MFRFRGVGREKGGVEWSSLQAYYKSRRIEENYKDEKLMSHRSYQLGGFCMN